MSTKRDFDDSRNDSMGKDLEIHKQMSKNPSVNVVPVNKNQMGELEVKATQEAVTTNGDDTEEINPDKIDNENLIKKNFQLKEENIRLKCSFEAEKFSTNIIYGAKIESLEKELQQILYENHHLRQQMSKMKYTIGSLAKMVKKSCKLYLGEREFPPNNEYFESDSEIDHNDPKYFPIEELQDQIQQLLCDYREYISMFAEKRGKSVVTRNSHQRLYEGFQTKSNYKKLRKSSEDLRIGYRRSNLK